LLHLLSFYWGLILNYQTTLTYQTGYFLLWLLLIFFPNIALAERLFHPKLQQHVPVNFETYLVGYTILEMTYFNVLFLLELQGAVFVGVTFVAKDACDFVV